MSSKPNRYDPINPSYAKILHGGDYNPDQWAHTPEIWDEDMRLMNLAHCNTMSVGIFSWAALEPEEAAMISAGWTRSWTSWRRKGRAPAGHAERCPPAWMSQKYPEVLRVAPNRHRNLHGQRHNHCYTSPVYREKTRPSTGCWPSGTRITPRCWCGTFPTSMAGSAIASCVRQRSAIF